jgi:predicted nucleotidyltransferase
VNAPALTPCETTLIQAVLRRHPEVAAAKLFGSRAKGTHTPHSDVDLALWGEIDEVRAQAIATELDELQLPYRFDVTPFGLIKLGALRDHIQRVGMPLYPETAASGLTPS